MAIRTVFIIGATGKQGRAAIHSLLRPSRTGAEGDDAVADYHVLALTRDASSPAAKALFEAEKEYADKITVVQQNLDDAAAVRKIFAEATQNNAPLWGIFVVLAYPGLGSKTTPEGAHGRVRRKEDGPVLRNGPVIESLNRLTRNLAYRCLQI
jgi:NAD(P)-dependent dehydrogenase (short-subunit alcohol dehydrogenase family)